jgi:hypothetical protein
MNADRDDIPNGEEPHAIDPYDPAHADRRDVGERTTCEETR